MRFLLLLFLVVLTPLASSGQAEQALVEEDSVSVWTRNLVATVAGSQAAYRNWQEGGVNTLAYTLKLDGNFVRKGETWGQDHLLQLGFGQVRQEEVGLRKALDILRYAFALRLEQPGPFSPTAATSFRTQFAPGYDYEKDPHRKISDFFAPATFTQSVGVTYQPTDGFKTRLGLAAKETVVTIERLRSRYNVPLGTGVRFEAGLESLTELAKEIADNVLLESRLGLFASFNQPDRPDLFWENALKMKVNSWLTTNFEVDLLYDRDVSTELQVKEVLSLGISIVMLKD